MNSQKQALRMHLNAIKKQLRSPVAFYVVLAEVGGSAAAGLFLSQTLYWTARTSDPDGWFYKTREDWTREIGLTRTQQEGVRRLLRARGFLRESRRGIPPTLYYRLDLDRLDASVVQHAGKRPFENAENASGKRRVLGRMYGGASAQRAAGSPPVNKGTEITSKNTAEISTEIKGPYPRKPSFKLEQGNHSLNDNSSSMTEHGVDGDPPAKGVGERHGESSLPNDIHPFPLKRKSKSPDELSSDSKGAEFQKAATSSVISIDVEDDPGDCLILTTQERGDEIRWRDLIHEIDRCYEKKNKVPCPWGNKGSFAKLRSLLRSAPTWGHAEWVRCIRNRFDSDSSRVNLGEAPECFIPRLKDFIAGPRSKFGGTQNGDDNAQTTSQSGPITFAEQRRRNNELNFENARRLAP
jgi:hypothetical protein